MYVVFEREAREYLFFLLIYSKNSLVSRTQPISLTHVNLLCPSLITIPLEYSITHSNTDARTQVHVSWILEVCVRCPDSFRHLDPKQDAEDWTASSVSWTFRNLVEVGFSIVWRNFSCLEVRPVKFDATQSPHSQSLVLIS